MVFSSTVLILAVFSVGKIVKEAFVEGVVLCGKAKSVVSILNWFGLVVGEGTVEVIIVTVGCFFTKSFLFWAVELEQVGDLVFQVSSLNGNAVLEIVLKVSKLAAKVSIETINLCY